MESRLATTFALLCCSVGALCTMALPEGRGRAPEPAPAGPAPTEPAPTLGERALELERLSGMPRPPRPSALVRLAGPEDALLPPAVPDELRSALRRALVRSLASPEAFEDLPRAWRLTPAELRTELVRAVGERGDPAGLEFLAWVVTFEAPGVEREVASALLRLAPEAREPEQRAALDELCVLLESDDPACLQSASIALSRARVAAAVPAWIELLGSESRAVRACALRSLESSSGLSLGEGPERWLAWHASELAWFEHELPAARDELESGAPERVLAAIRAIAARRLFQDELAQALLASLEDADQAVRTCACRALATLRSRVALEALVATLEDEDPSVARAAWEALRAISGSDLPPDASLWRAAVAGN